MLETLVVHAQGPAAPAEGAGKPMAPPSAQQAPNTPVRVAPTALKPVVGRGFHLFDRNYVLFGLNLQNPCGSTVVEFETSLVPHISDGLFWGGYYLGAGFQRLHGNLKGCAQESVSKDETRHALVDGATTEEGQTYFRGAAGLEGGWRFLAFDVGYLRNDTRQAYKDGVRFRLGLAFSMEVFTGGDAEYQPTCCKPAGPTPCECERTPVGLSVFAYYGNELYADWWDDGMVGLSVKLGIGAWGTR